MKHSQIAKTSLVLLVLGLVTASIARAEDMYVGRSTGAVVLIDGSTPGVYADTGELPIEGGMQMVDMDSLEICDQLKSENILTWTRGEAHSTQSSAAQDNIIAFPLHPGKVTATHLEAEARAVCGAVFGSVIITDLVFGGNPVTVTGEVNQEVTIAGLGKLILNERDEDPRAGLITVTAVHIILENGPEMLLSTAKAGVVCLTATKPASWEGMKRLYR